MAYDECLRERRLSVETGYFETGFGFGILLHVFWSGFHFLNFNFISRIIIGSLVFMIDGYLEALFTWEKYKKKYS